MAPPHAGAKQNENRRCCRHYEILNLNLRYLCIISSHNVKFIVCTESLDQIKIVKKKKRKTEARYKRTSQRCIGDAHAERKRVRVWRRAVCKCASEVHGLIQVLNSITRGRGCHHRFPSLSLASLSDSDNDARAEFSKPKQFAKASPYLVGNVYKPRL